MVKIVSTYKWEYIMKSLTVLALDTCSDIIIANNCKAVVAMEEFVDDKGFRKYSICACQIVVFTK